jgi:hypothetical protein
VEDEMLFGGVWEGWDGSECGCGGWGGYCDNDNNTEWRTGRSERGVGLKKQGRKTRGEERWVDTCLRVSLSFCHWSSACSRAFFSFIFCGKPGRKKWGKGLKGGREEGSKVQKEGRRRRKEGRKAWKEGGKEGVKGRKEGRKGGRKEGRKGARKAWKEGVVKRRGRVVDEMGAIEAMVA